LGLDGEVPDHSTFSKNRHGRFRDSDLLRKVFETTVQRCIDEGLVGGEGFAVDASMIKADANRQHSVPGSEWQAPEAANHAVREYLAVLDDAAFGGATPVVPKFISSADPASRWTGANGGLAFFAYCTNYLIDLKHAVILDVEATTAIRQTEVTAQQRMIDRTQERFGLCPERLAADAAYGSAENLAWLVMSVISSRTFRCSTNPSVPTAPSRATTLPTTTNATATPALPGLVTVTRRGRRARAGNQIYAAATAACHSAVASARKIRSVDREMRWR
jgi:hypothetical protein